MSDFKRKALLAATLAGLGAFGLSPPDIPARRERTPQEKETDKARYQAAEEKRARKAAKRRRAGK